MKYLIILLLVLGACQPAQQKTPQSSPGRQVAYGDTFYVAPSETVHDTITVCKNDSLLKVIDSISASRDTLARRLLHSRLVISNVKYYLAICLKNPSQDKFLKGWIRRAVE